MSMTVFSIVLLAAALHATWNAIVKGAGDALLTTILVTASAALIAVAGLPFLPRPFSSALTLDGTGLKIAMQPGAQ